MRLIMKFNMMSPKFNNFHLNQWCLNHQIGVKKKIVACCHTGMTFKPCARASTCSSKHGPDSKNAGDMMASMTSAFCSFSKYIR